jgi:hypothetical protein
VKRIATVGVLVGTLLTVSACSSSGTTPAPSARAISAARPWPLPHYRASGPPKFIAGLSHRIYTGPVQFLSAATGHLTGEIPDPSGDYFTGVAAEPDGRTFVVAVSSTQGCDTHLFLVRLNKAGRPGPLQRVPQPGPLPGIKTVSIALSPDGSTLVYFASTCQRRQVLVRTDLQTGRSRTWQSHFTVVRDLTASDGGAVVSFGAYQVTDSDRPPPLVTAVLRVPGPPGGRIVPLPQWYAQTALSPNGKVLFVCALYDHRNVLFSYAAASGKKRAELASWPAKTGSCNMAMAPSGRYLLLADVRRHLAIFHVASGHLAASSAPSLWTAVNPVW